MAQVKIEAPIAATGGTYTVNAYLNGGQSPVIATAINADRWDAIKACVALLDETEQGDLRLATIIVTPPDPNRGPAPLFE